MKRYAVVDFTGPNVSCLASVSWMTSSGGTQNVNVVKIEDRKQRSHYVSVVSNFSSDSSMIRLNGKFGQLLGLKHGESVTVSDRESTFPSLKRVQVHCESEDDWEILEPNAESMTNNLLNQLRVVYVGLKFPFWISKSLSVNLCVDSLEPPCEVGLLETFTEIVVPSATLKSDVLQVEGKRRFRAQPLALLPTIKLSESSELLLQNTTHCFIFQKNLWTQEGSKDDGNDTSTSFLAKIIPEKSQTGLVETKNVVKILFIESVLQTEKELTPLFPYSSPPRIFIHSKLCEQLGIQFKSYVFIEQVRNDPSMDITPTYCSPATISKSEVNTQRTFNKIFSDAQEFVALSLGLNSAHVEVSQRAEWGWMLITGKAGSGKTFFVTNLCKDFQDFPYYVHYEIIQCSKYRGRKSETVQKELESISKEAAAFSPTIIVLDDLDVICPSSKSEQQNVHEEFLHFRMCETIFESMMTLLRSRVLVICTARSYNSLNDYWKAREGFHAFHHNVHIPPPNPLERLDIFQACLGRYQCGAETGAANTTSSSSASPLLPQLAAKSPGTGGTTEDVEVDRMNIGRNAFLQNRLMTTVMLNALLTLHDDESSPKGIHNVAKKWALTCNSPSFYTLSPEEKDREFLRIIENETKFSNQAKDTPAKHVKWEDVGGLVKVKSELTKILQWPVKYAKLFEEAPIKLPSGILLYGYPGTGKTLVGLSMPSLVPNAKFIHIKGPELLSKYIGASEQAVQDLFQKAKDLSPCILFFDEFDSLVPRRGHDSTGVTDRVVNQFLAEMDGIEGGLGKGVYLVAATSRPDLIDPAVLRPGRLDRHLFFPLPDKGERMEIVSALGKDLTYSDADGDILWDEIGRETEGFTGADLHSLLCTAQLEAIQESLSPILQGDETSAQLSSITTEKIGIGRRHLEKSLENFKSSLPPDELNKFRAIYEKFSPMKEKKKPASGSGNSDNNGLMEFTKRATLA